MMGYYLLDNPNPFGPHYYTTRRAKLVGIVIHCTAGLEDLDLIGPDLSAENTARYAATTERVVSWHSGSDSDSNLELLPAEYTAFQCRGYNSSTYGHEISKRDMVWSDEPAEWVERTLAAPAEHLRLIALEAGIPIRKIDKTQLDRAVAAGDPSLGGFIGHRELDPTRRTDPGADFPWDRFLEGVRGMALTAEEEKFVKSMVEIIKNEKGSNAAVFGPLVDAVRDGILTETNHAHGNSGGTVPAHTHNGTVTSTVRLS